MGRLSTALRFREGLPILTDPVCQALDLFVDTDIKEAVEALPDNFRIPVLLADVEGFSYKEIAEIMDVPIGTVMSRLHRGRKALERTLWRVAEERGIAETA